MTQLTVKSVILEEEPQITIDEDGGIHALFMSWDKEDYSYGSDEYPWEDGCWSCTQGKQRPDKGLWYVHWNPSTGSWKEHKIIEMALFRNRNGCIYGDYTHRLV